MFNKYDFFKLCKFCQILHFILRIYHNIESYQNMLTTLAFCFLYHKIQLCFVCHAHYTLLTCGKRFLKILNAENTLNFQNFKILYLLNCEWFLNLGNTFLSSKFFDDQNYVITIVFYLVFCKINHIWCNTYSSLNVLSKNQNPKFNLMNCEFELFNFHINHLAQLGMINITLKWQEKNICKNVHNFHHYLTWFLAPIFVFAPNWSYHRSKISFYQQC